MQKRVFNFILCIIILFSNLLGIQFIEVSASSETFVTKPKIAIGGNHTIALKGDGTVWTWGENEYGQLGNGAYVDSKFEPVQVLGLENVIDIDANEYGSVALKSDGTIWGWGNLRWIKGYNDDANIPVQLEGIEDVIDIALGYSSITVVKSDGTVWTWGQNDAGQLGNNDYKVFERYEPGKVEGITDVVAVSALDRQIVALKSDGTVWVWGCSIYYGFVSDGCYYPVKVNGIKDIEAIDIGKGDCDVYMLHEQGSVWKLDSPKYAVDENKEKVLATQPEQIKGFFNIKTIAGGNSFIWAIDSIGDVWTYDELGNELDENIDEPVKIENIQECIFVEANIAIKKDGSIWDLPENGTPYRKFDNFSLLKVELSGISLDGPKEVQGSDMCVVELESSIELSLICEPLDATIDKSKVKWATSDATIATVESGIVTGIKQGRVTITASIEGKEASYVVIVIPAVGYNACNYCNGGGKTKCGYCNEVGNKKCNICSGDGITITTKSCTKCDSSGEISVNKECPICHGTKVSFSEEFQSYVSCIGCGGTGAILYTSDCETCDGIGKVSSEVNCITCGGTGQYKCSNCDNGYNECYSCAGEGKIKCKLYAIIYDANGGTNSPYTKVKIENKKLQINDIKPVREGYVFCGWALESSATMPDFKIGDYITDNKSIELYAVWEEEKTLTSISITQMPYKVSYTEGETFNSSGLVVTAHYSNNTTQNITGYEITGYESTPGEKRISITYNNKIVSFSVNVQSKIPKKITSNAYKVSDAVISKIAIGTSAKKLLSSINENEYVRVFKNQTEIKADGTIGTGMTAKIMDDSTVVKSYTIIVTGDVNGDGNTSVTDMLAIKAHILGKNKLSGEYATAADTSGDSTISITDFIQTKAKVLGKGNITAR